MPQGSRTDRVSEEFREILAESIQGLKDPRVGFVTVTAVKVSPDLHVAWVYYTVLGDAKEKVATRAALRSATLHLRRVLGRQIRLKVTPELRFQEDDLDGDAARIERLLDQVHQEEHADGA